MLYTFDSVSPLLTQPVHDTLTDEQLLQAIVRKDRKAFEELYRRYSRMLHSIANRVIYDEFLAEDVVQEIFVDLWESASKYNQSKGKVAGWLTTIARRRAIDSLRKMQCRQRASDRLELDVEKQPAAWKNNEIENEIEASDFHKLLGTAIAKLPEAQRDALNMAYFQGLSQREIAARTRIPLGTIKTRLDLAMRKLSSAVRALMNDNLNCGIPA